MKRNIGTILIIIITTLSGVGSLFMLGLLLTTNPEYQFAWGWRPQVSTLTTSIKKIRITIPWVRGAPEALLQKPYYAAALFISLFIYVAFRSRWHTTPAMPEIASSDNEDPRYREFFATEEEIKFATQQADMPVLPPPPPVPPIKVRRKLHRGQ